MNYLYDGRKGGKIMELRKELRMRDNPVVNFHSLNFVEFREVVFTLAVGTPETFQVVFEEELLVDTSQVEVVQSGGIVLSGQA